jgi:hypothetical protein
VLPRAGAAADLEVWGRGGGARPVVEADAAFGRRRRGGRGRGWRGRARERSVGWGPPGPLEAGRAEDA